jgi:hypothetical protein
VKQPVVYILADKPYGTLYIGVEEMNPEWKDLSSQAFEF